MRFQPFVLAIATLAAVGCAADDESPTGPAAPAASPPQPLTAAASIVAFTAVSVGGDHACAIAPDQRGYCWGGSGGATPALVAPNLRWLQLRAGFDYTCGITTDNKGWCWGRNTEGQVGSGSSALFVADPVQVAGGRRYKLLRTGDSHACATTLAGVTWCWGRNAEGQLGDGTTTERRKPVKVGGGLTFTSVSPGIFHTCGIAGTNTAYCWGLNKYGQIGIGNSFNQSLPRAVSGGLSFKTIAAGANHTCAVSTSDDAYCWGRNDQGQLGDNTTSRHGKPEKVLGGLKFRGVGAGLAHSCGVTISRQAWCWGYNQDGGLGDGTDGPFASRRLLPVKVVLDVSWDAVLPANAANSTCGIIVEGRVYCWGSNIYGNLGDGTHDSRKTPNQVVVP